MTELMQARVDLVMLALDERRITGLLAPWDPVSPKEMARMATQLGAPVSEATFRAICRRGCEKLSLHPHVQALSTKH